MKITGPGPIRPAETRRRTKSPGASHERFSVDSSADAPSSAAVTSTNALASVEVLLTLQDVHQDIDGRRKALQRGHRLLDRLDDIRHGLLTGAIPRHKLQALADAAGQEKAKVADPRLAEILGEIELRAAVELAKFGRVA